MVKCRRCGKEYDTAFCENPDCPSNKKDEINKTQTTDLGGSKQQDIKTGDGKDTFGL